MVEQSMDILEGIFQDMSLYTYIQYMYIYIYMYVYCLYPYSKGQSLSGPFGSFLFLRKVCFLPLNESQPGFFLRPRSVNSYSWSVALSRWKVWSRESPEKSFFSHGFKTTNATALFSQCMNIITSKKGRGREFKVHRRVKDFIVTLPHLPGFWLNASSAI